jgi:molybdopterin synthase catalytic subunit
MSQNSTTFVQITKDILNLESLVKLVDSPSAGAISTFSGTTRDNFNGKKVLKLEYEAYLWSI